MKRRKALQQIGWGLSAGLLAPQWLASCAKDSRGPIIKYNGKVAIIGAGAAGLYAADVLSSQGIDVFLLEARADLGGRIRSFSTQDAQQDNSSDAFLYDYNYPPVADFPVELGGDLIFGSDSAWGKIISVLNIPAGDLSAAASQFILDSQAKSATDWQGDADFSAVQNFVSGLNTYAGADVSVASAAAVNARAQALLNAQAANYFGSSADRISALGLGNELSLRTHDAKVLTVKNHTWQDILLSRFSSVFSKIKLKTPVTSIDYSGDKVSIVDKNGNSYEADKVVITVPVSILKSSGITFTPSLPGTNTAAAGKFGMDACVRVLMDFKKNFWGDDAGFIWGGTAIPQYFNAGYARSSINISLMMTICGAAAESLSTTPGTIVTNILAELDAIYGGAATKQIRRKIIFDSSNQPVETDPVATAYDWTKDPYIKGGYSYPLVGATHQDRIDLGTAVPGGKIFFAGEATDINGDAGTVSGALQSADRVTKEVIKSITG